MSKEISAIKTICDNYRDKTRIYKTVKPIATGKTRIKGISISDLHIPFVREDLVNSIIKKHSGEDFVVINGDILDSNLISSFSKNKEVPFVMEYNAAFELVKLLSKHFKEVILVEGNHDIGRYNREMQKLNPTVHFLVKTSPLAYLARGQKFSESGEDLGQIHLPNVTYAGDVNPRGWWYKIGKTIFCHRLSGYRKGPMNNAAYMAEYFIEKGFEFQCIVNGHSHKVGWCSYKEGRLVIDQGALCYPGIYSEDGRGAPVRCELGYAVIEMDSKGNIDYENTKPIFLGTYTERLD